MTVRYDTPKQPTPVSPRPDGGRRRRNREPRRDRRPRPGRFCRAATRASDGSAEDSRRACDTGTRATRSDSGPVAGERHRPRPHAGCAAAAVSDGRGRESVPPDRRARAHRVPARPRRSTRGASTAAMPGPTIEVERGRSRSHHRREPAARAVRDALARPRGPDGDGRRARALAGPDQPGGRFTYEFTLQPERDLLLPLAHGDAGNDGA